MQKPNGRRGERKGMKSRSSVCTALVTFPFLENLLVLRMDHLKSEGVWWGGEGRRGKFSVYTISFFFHRDKHEYFYSGAEIFIFVVVVL